MRGATRIAVRTRALLLRSAGTLRSTLYAAGLAAMLALPAARAAGPYDGRYSLEDGTTVRVLTAGDGALLLTAETVGTQFIPRNPRISDVQVQSARYFNGRFAPSSANPGKFERVFAPAGIAGSEFHLFLQAGDGGLLATWVQFPDALNSAGSGFRKALRLTPAAALTSPSASQDLAGRWVAGSDVLEIFSAAEALTVFRSQASPMLEPSPLETFSASGEDQRFAGPVGFVIEAVSATRLLLRNGPSVKEFSRDAGSPPLPGAEQRLGLARRNANGETLLHLAARAGDAAALERALGARLIDVDAVSAQGQTALHLAVEGSRPDIAQALLRAGASTALADRGGRTAVQLAAANGDAAMLSAMAGAGANLGALADQAVSSGDMNAIRALLGVAGMGATLATRAVERRKPAVLDEVLVTRPELVTLALYQSALADRETARSVLSYAPKSGFDFDAAMQSTIQRDQRALMSDLLQRGAKPDAALLYAVSRSDLQLMTELVETYGASADVPLVPAIRAGQLPIVLLLLQNGADASRGLGAAIEANQAPMVEALVKQGAPAADPQFIDKAVRAGNADMLRALLAAGAPAQAGLAPAVAARRSELLKLLLDAGADGADPALLQAAAGHGDDASVALLLGAGAPAAAALRAGIGGGSQAVVTRLIQAGADASDPQLLIDATTGSRSGAARALIAAGADPNSRDANGRPLIVIAAASADVETLDALLRAGADKEAADSAGTRAIHAAVVRKKGELEIVERLIAAGVDVNAPDGNGRLPRALSSGIRVPWALRSAGAKNKLDE